MYVMLYGVKVCVCVCCVCFCVYVEMVSISIVIYKYIDRYIYFQFCVVCRRVCGYELINQPTNQSINQSIINQPTQQPLRQVQSNL